MFKFGCKYSFFQQHRGHIALGAQYLPELAGKACFDKFGLRHPTGDSLAFYMDDYLLVRNYAISEFGLKTFDQVSPEQFLSSIAHVRPKVIRYFCEDTLRQHQLNIVEFNDTANLGTVSGVHAKKEGHQNCLVLKGGVWYLAPKIRAMSKEDLNEHGIGVSHSSMSRNGKVEYAGSFTHEYVEIVGKKAWVLDNATGHYATRPYQIMTALTSLKEHGMDLSHIIVRLYTPTDKGRTSFSETYEKADALIMRMGSDNVRPDEFAAQSKRARITPAAATP